MRWIKTLVLSVTAVVLVAGAALYVLLTQELTFSPSPQAYDLKFGNNLRTVARELAAKFGVPMDSGAALATVGDRTKPPQERVACLMQLAQDRDGKLPQALDVPRLLHGSHGAAHAVAAREQLFDEA